MRAPVLLCFSAWLSAAPAASVDLQPVSIETLATQVAVEGVPSAAFHVGTGPNASLLVLSHTGAISDPDGAEGSSAFLYATHFLPDASKGWQSSWRVQDWVRDCPLDLSAAFTDPAVQVSDADHDDVPEIWVAYRLACRGDVSPSTLKVIGYEGQQKYALRGRSRIALGEQSEGGDYTADPALAAEPALLQTASAFWKQVVDESF